MPTAADLRAFVREATTNQSSTTEGTSTNQECDGHVHSQAFKIVVLGSASCGKTSIIKQFVGNGQDFEEQYEPTEKKTSYFKTILTFDTNTQRITHWAVKLVDVPVTEVPVGSAGSWNSWLSFDVTAAAYVLVFDVSAHLHSFEFVRTIRDQLINHPSTSSALIFIAANKVDLSYQLNRSDVAQIVQKQWKLPYVECSAKKNFRIVGLFHSIIEQYQIEQSAAARARAHHSDGFHIRRTFKSHKCNIQ